MRVYVSASSAGVPKDHTHSSIRDETRAKATSTTGLGSNPRGLIIPEPNWARGAESWGAHCYADDRRAIPENVTGTLIIYATRLLLNATVIMFAEFCDGESVQGLRRIIASQLSSRCSKGESAEEHSRDAKERKREKGRSRGRKTSTYELNYIRQSWRPITYSARVTRDSNPD